ncbi:hypothetical protein [Mucilaginibacter sp. KACC 22063]|uniref:hypothetical protein n=1 Tax=Mucilaginibacter sp. KACC 22063 TaxID=3025666 RepID=UPI002366AB8B|nr:hypothetical protein [Mucilaginibacter sp. KACC 22063]WDF57251.1 hypothetical protein PQ461_09320 [Mucilaginibacter sp. KACC 22063]
MADITLDFTGNGYSSPAYSGSKGRIGTPDYDGGDGGPGGNGENGSDGLPGFNAQWTLTDVTGKLTINAWGSPGQDGGQGGQGGDGWGQGKGGKGGNGGNGGDGGSSNQVVIYIKGKLPPLEINTGNSMPGKKGPGGPPGNGNSNYGAGNDGMPGNEGGPSTVTIIRI